MTCHVYPWHLRFGVLVCLFFALVCRDCIPVDPSNSPKSGYCIWHCKYFPFVTGKLFWVYFLLYFADAVCFLAESDQNPHSCNYLAGAARPWVTVNHMQAEVSPNCRTFLLLDLILEWWNQHFNTVCFVFFFVFKLTMQYFVKVMSIIHDYTCGFLHLHPYSQEVLCLRISCARSL